MFVGRQFSTVRINSLRLSDTYMPGRRQAIIWTNDEILLTAPLGKKLQWNFNGNSNIFIQENTLENGIHFVSASMLMC